MGVDGLGSISTHTIQQTNSRTCLNCGHNPTIRAHLFPKSFCKKIGVDLDGKPEHFAFVSDGGKSLTPTLGLFDDGILCAKCDQKLGNYDKYAYQWTEKTKAEVLYSYRDRMPNLLMVKGDPTVLLNFALSIVWRFAASSRLEAGLLPIGPYLRRLQPIIFNAAPIGSMIDCMLVAAKPWMPGAENHFSIPVPIRNRYLNGVRFFLNGFEYHVRLGAEKSKMSSDIWPRRAWLRKAQNVSFVIMPLEQTLTGREFIRLEARGNPATSFFQRSGKRS